MRSMLIASILFWLLALLGVKGYAAEEAAKPAAEEGGARQKEPAISEGLAQLPDENKLWEPWVDTAVVGDRVVRNYSTLGYREHREVTAVDDTSVTVVIKRTYDKTIFQDGSDTIWRRVYSRTRYPALEEFYAGFKVDGGDPIQGVAIKSQDMPCAPMSAAIITANSIKDGALTIMGRLRCRIWVHKDIPLGGVAKRLKWEPSPFSKAGDEPPKGRMRFDFVLEDFARGDDTPSAWLLQTYQAARPSDTMPVAVRREAPKGKALPEQLVGWRGDGSGRFAGCAPPLRWGRISKTMSSLRTQATKPKGEAPGEESGPILHGTVRDWLVLYPVPAEGSDKELAGKDLIPAEASLEPDAGDKVGELQWRPVSVEGSALYFNRILANARSLKGQAVYAHAYIYSPSPRHVFMWIGSAAPARVLLNGEELRYNSGRAVRVQLKQGWNRILARVLSTSKAGGYAPDVCPEGAASFLLEMSGGEANEEYEENGILWTVEPPQAGQPSYYHPIIVGDRLYVTSSPAFLVCYDKLTGKRLWIRDNGFYEFFTDEERKAHPELFEEIDPKVKRFKELAGSYGGTLDEHEEIEEIHNEIAKLMRKVDPVRYFSPRGQEPGLASQPISDGKYIYTWCYLGIAACYDLDGNRKWMIFEPEGPQEKHGYELAPMLVGRDMVVAMRSIIGFDRETGRVNWKIPDSGSVYHRDGEPRKGSQTDAVNYDGLGLYKPGLGFFPWSHTTREGNMLYRIDHDGVVGRRSTLPEPMTEAPELKEWGPATWYEPADAPIILPGTYRRASLVQGNPLYYDGLIYTISTGGVLRVEESGTNRHVYSRLVGLNQVIDGLQPHNAGICASPTQAGDYVYLFGADGATLVIKAGRKYEEVAKNRIERMLPPPRLAWGQRRSAEQMVSDRRSEVTISSPIFNGGRMYYRAERYLYCIGSQ